MLERNSGFINAKNAETNSPLHLAQSPEMVKLLLNSGALVANMNSFQEDAFQSAYRRGISSVCHALLSLDERYRRFKLENPVLTFSSISFQTSRNTMLETAYSKLMPSIVSANFRNIEIRIKYEGENGSDVGGLFRSWMSLIIQRLFLPPQFFDDVESEKNVLSEAQTSAQSVSSSSSASSSSSSASAAAETLETIESITRKYIRKPFKEPPFVRRDDVSPYYVPNLKFEGTIDVWRFVGFLFALVLKRDFNFGVMFAPSIYKQLLGMELSAHDLKDDDPAMYKRFLSILEPSFDFDKAELYFETGEPVNAENAMDFVHEQALTAMKYRYRDQLGPLKNGFVSSTHNINLPCYFTWQELSTTLTGIQVVDRQELLRKCLDKTSKLTNNWDYLIEAFEILSNEELLQFVRFVTGRYGLPFGGIGNLEKCIYVFDSPDEYFRAGTCHFHFKLPKYFRSTTDFLERLRLALNSPEEFDECNYFRQITAR